MVKEITPFVMNETLRSITEEVVNLGGTACLVGGAVRDMLMGNNNPKDLDVEVYGVGMDTLKSLLSNFGKTKVVGEAFGIIKLTDENGTDFDFSLPRRENKAGVGHKGFTCEFDPTITYEEAASRRDFTINSVFMNLNTGKIEDPFAGERDILEGSLRATSPAFQEDPLRVLRGMQFAGRFGMRLADSTKPMCVDMKGEFGTLATPRVWEEWKKWADKSTSPSKGLEFLKESTWVDLWPELNTLIGLEQEPAYHPEGSVWNHTCLCCDEAVSISNRDKLSKEDRRVLVFSALCHDLGKATTTVVIDGKITSRGHDRGGEAPTRSFLTSIGAPKDLVESVVVLVTNHMAHVGVELNQSNVRRIANRLAPHSNIQMLGRVMEADHSGRSPLPKGMPCPALLELAKELDVANGKPQPILTGKLCLEHGVPPGKGMGALMKKAFEAQLSGELTPDNVDAWILKNKGGC